MKKRLIKEDIVSAVSKDTNCPRYVAEEIINSMLDNITLALSQGNEVQFANFGTFEPKHRAARTGRNPRTNEPVPIPERTVPSFKASKLLKTRVCTKMVSG